MVRPLPPTHTPLLHEFLLWKHHRETMRGLSCFLSIFTEALAAKEALYLPGTQMASSHSSGHSQVQTAKGPAQLTSLWMTEPPTSASGLGCGWGDTAIWLPF